ncbi:MAG: T9SS type A sorting domain-containing protein [Bacteroidales bacterium]|nr:T9SS type A sorting domain-containing protein [Bacteroidales bacterium]
MKVLFTTILLSGIFIGSRAQNTLQNLKIINAQILKSSATQKSPPLKGSSLNYFINYPDSMLFYSDSLELEATYSFVNEYTGHTITCIRKYPENNQWINELKIEYYLDENLSEMKFEPILGGSSGEINEYMYTYESSIGDTLSIKYTWDGDLKKWTEQSMTKHYFSETGIDTLAITYARDADAGSMFMNNQVKQRYIEGSSDSLFLTMYLPDESDTLLDYLYVYRYNTGNQPVLIIKSSHGYTTTDSLVYDENGLLVFEYKGSDGVYNYLYEHRYDSEHRRISTYFWDKQQGQTEWEFDGAFNLYYPAKTNIAHLPVAKDMVNIYPNPSTGLLFIRDYKGIVTINDMKGDVLIRETVNGSSNIDIVKLPKGIYLVSFSNGEVKKVIKK